MIGFLANDSPLALVFKISLLILNITFEALQLALFLANSLFRT